MASCRFCLGPEDEDKSGPELLADVCECRGTQRYVHASCLEQWQLACLGRGEWHQARHCSVCDAPYARGLPWPWNALWALGSAPAILRISAAPLPFWALLAAFLPLWDAFSAGLILAVLVALGSGVVVWRGFEAMIVSLAVFVLSWVLLLALPYVLRRHRGAPALWTSILASAEPGEPFGRGAWWGEVQDGGLLYPAPLRSTGSSLALVNSSLLLLYGGWTNDEGPRSTLWLADWRTVRATQRLDWSLVAVNPPHLRPSETYGQSFTPLGGDRLLVFGGHTRGGYRGPSAQWRVLALGPGAESASWTAAGTAPLGVAWHSATLIGPGHATGFPTGFVFVFGGCGPSGATQSVQVFDLSALEGNGGGEPWQLDPEYISGRPPPPRSGHTATLASDGRLWILGGTSGDPMPWVGQDLDDGLWDFHAAPLAWRERRAVPGLRAPRQHTAVPTGGGLLVFGGGTGGSADLQVVREDAETSGLTLDRPSLAGLRGAMNLTVTGRAGATPMTVELASAQPPPLRGHCALWTGAEMLVFGGSTSESAWEEYSGMLVMRPV